MRRFWIVMSVMVCAATNAAAAPGDVGIRANMPYGKARAILVRNGWRPEITHIENKTRLDRQIQAWFIRRGYSEAYDCQPTAPGFCKAVFTFVSRKGEVDSLDLVTTEPDGVMGPRIVSWSK